MTIFTATPAAGRYITLGCCLLNRRKLHPRIRPRRPYRTPDLHPRNTSGPIFPDGAGIGLLPSEDVEFDTLCIEFSPNMSVLMFTDGINEATSPKNR